MEDEIEDLHTRLSAMEAELTANDDEIDALEKAVASEKTKVGMYREGMDNLRHLLLVAVGGDDLSVLYEDKSASDLAIEVALLIGKLSDQKFKPGSIRGEACGVVRELVAECLLDDPEESYGDPTDALSVYNDLEEIVVEMTARSMAHDPAHRRLFDAVDKLAPILTGLGYLETGPRGSVDRVKIIEGVLNLIRRRVMEDTTSRVDAEATRLGAEVVTRKGILPSLSKLAAAAQQTTPCVPCGGKGNVVVKRSQSYLRTHDPTWETCNICEGRGSTQHVK
jgi:hypothetical protein